MNPKTTILQLLRREGDVVSGAAMSARLGVSRVSIWKHIRGLQEAGYAIEAGATGYRLAHETDLLQPWEFPGREARVHCHAVLESTMDEARKLAREGCPAFTVVTADRQTRGRGRLDRRWQSAPGGLYFTLVLRPRLPASLAALVTFAAGLEWARLLADECGVAVGLKWPNDLLVGERKLAGMLSEMEAPGDLVTFVNVGIGLNVNNAPAAADLNAVSLKELTGQAQSRCTLLGRFLARMESRLQDQGLSGVTAEWKTCAATLGRPVRIATLNDTIEGVARDVDETGALMVELSDGTLTRVVHGDCFHQAP